MTRRTLLAAAVASACAPPAEISVVDWPRVSQLAAHAPGVVYFWALWSRPSVELLSTVAELADQYAELRCAAVCLDDDPSAATGRALSVTRALPVSLTHFIAPLDFERLEADYQLTEPPAAVIIARSGVPLARLQGDGLTPDRLDAFAAEAAAIMTTPPSGR